MVAALGGAVTGCAGYTGGIVPDESHLIHKDAVKPAGSVVVRHGPIMQTVHIFLHPTEGEFKLLAGLVVPGEVHISVAVVILNVGNVLRLWLID